MTELRLHLLLLLPERVPYTEISYSRKACYHQNRPDQVYLAMLFCPPSCWNSTICIYYLVSCFHNKKIFMHKNQRAYVILDLLDRLFSILYIASCILSPSTIRLESLHLLTLSFVVMAVQFFECQ